MRIRIQCLGGLRNRQPLAGWLELTEQARLSDVFAALQISPAEVQLSRIDGRFEYDPDYSLRDGETVSILPYTFAHAGALSDAGA